MNVIVGGVVKKDNKYLLVKEGLEEFYGMYNIPAGKLDENELLIDGAKREIKEETGYDVDIKGIIHIGNTKQMVSVIFLCETVSNQEEFDKDEILSTEWFTYDEIVELKDHLRSPNLLIDAIRCADEDKIYSLDILKM